MARLAIFDYGAGNILSLRNALERAGAGAEVITDVSRAAEYSGLLLPGVGSFDPAVGRLLPDEGAREAFAGLQGTVPVLGICLGMEVMFEGSDEGSARGLGIVGGRVVSLPGTMRVPHMGWNGLRVRRPGRLLRGVGSGSWAYFVHSYAARPSAEGAGAVTAEADYGEPVPAAVESGTMFGTQFHPEKSGATGRAIIGNFVRECSA